MPTVDNVKLTLKKEAFKPSSPGGVSGYAWAGDHGGDWKATVTCDIELSINEPEIPYQVIITLYGKGEDGPPDSWVPVHRFFWGGSKGGYSGTTDHATVWKTTKKFSRYNYVASKKLNVAKAAKAQTSIGPGYKKQTVLIARAERIYAHVLVQKEVQGANSNEVKIKI